jgi:PGF-CTERM protein
MTGHISGRGQFLTVLAVLALLVAGAAPASATSGAAYWTAPPVSAQAGPAVPDGAVDSLSVAACTPISPGTTITSPGCYQLSGGVTDADTTPVVIRSSDVVLDGNGHRLDGDDSYGIYGVQVYGASIRLTNVTVRNVVATDWDTGVYVENATVTVENVNVTDNFKYGVRLELGDGSVVRDNVVDGNGVTGIEAAESANVELTGNSLDGNQKGLRLVKSTGATLRNNTVTATNLHAFAIFGDLTAHYRHDVDTTNTVHGDPVYYLLDPTDTVVDASTGAGMVVVVGGDNVTVRDLSLRNVGEGVALVDTSNSRVENVEVVDSARGVDLLNATMVTVNGTTLTSNDLFGVRVRGGSDVTLSNNSIKGTNNAVGAFAGTAIRLGDSPRATVADNVVSNSAEQGMRLYASPYTTIARNDFSNGYSGMDFDGHHLTVVDNVVDTYTWEALELTDGNDAIVTGNVLRNADTGLAVSWGDRMLVANNTMTGHTDGGYGEGLLVDDTVTDSVFRDNVVGGSDVGIRLNDYFEPINVSLLRNEVSASKDWDVRMESDYAPATLTGLVVDGRTVDLTLLAAAFRADAGPPTDPGGYENVSAYFETERLASGGYVELTAHYTDAEATAVEESTLTMWYHDGTAWVDQGGTSDPAANTVSGNLTTFGPVAPFGLPAGSATPASFDVVVDGSNSPVLEGDTLSVTVTVNNTGDSSGTKTVSLSVGGTQRDSASVTLAGGATQTVTLSWATSAGDAGDYTATVTSPDATDDTPVSVTAPGSLDVVVDGTNSPVVEGDALTVTTTVSNPGGTSESGTVTLDVGGTSRDSTSVTLAAGTSQTVTLSWATSTGDAGDYTATVSTPADAASTSVTVATPGSVTVAVDGSSSPVLEGETLSVTATLTNTGSASTTETLTLSVGGVVRDSTSVTLAGGASQQVTLAWTTSAGDAGDYTATVTAGAGTDSAAVTVTTPGSFAVGIDGTSSPVTEGDTLTVTATVTNVGGTVATRTVTLDVAGATRDSTSVTIAAGASQTVSLSWTTASGDAGDYTASVASPDDDATVGVRVEAASGGGGGGGGGGGTTGCTDADGDGYYVGCSDFTNNPGPDSDDGNPNVWTSGATCTDADGDGYYVGCDAYVTVDGPDADDGNANVWTSAAASQCKDADGDGYYVGCDAYVTVNGPDADDGNPNVWTSGAASQCEDADGDGYFVGCDAYVTVDGPDADDGNPNVWTSGAASQCEDADGDGYYVGCDAYVTVDGPDADDGNPNVWSATPTFEVRDVSVDTLSPVVGETVTVTATVVNHGVTAGSYTAELEAAGTTVDSRTVSVGSGEALTVTLDHSFDAAVSYDLLLNGGPIGTVTVREPSASSTTPTPTSTGAPGFGAGAALVALAAALLLARRR